MTKTIAQLTTATLPLDGDSLVEISIPGGGSRKTTLGALINLITTFVSTAGSDAVDEIPGNGQAINIITGKGGDLEGEADEYGGTGGVLHLEGGVGGNSADTNGGTGGHVQLQAGNGGDGEVDGGLGADCAFNGGAGGTGATGVGGNGGGYQFITGSGGNGATGGGNGGDFWVALNTKGTGGGSGRDGQFRITNLPTVDPGIADPSLVGEALWLDNGVLTISAGA